MDAVEVQNGSSWLLERLYKGPTLGFKKDFGWEDWYRISMVQIRKWVQIRSVKQLGKLLRIAYPQHQWEVKLSNLRYQLKASQREVVIAVQSLFPTHSMY